MSKHTNGPWTAETLGAQLRAVKIQGKNARRIIPLGGPALAYLPEGREDIQEANARLIAAAPDLLESLKDLIEYDIFILPEELQSEEYKRAIKAIRKAEGGDA